MNPGTKKEPFYLNFKEKYFNRGDKVVSNTSIRKPWRMFRWLGFNYTYQILSLSKPIQKGECWSYKVELQYEWLRWFNIKLLKLKIK